jgi:hypothetical protein
MGIIDLYFLMQLKAIYVSIIFSSMGANAQVAFSMYDEPKRKRR